jgi:hypothetical protein
MKTLFLVRGLPGSGKSTLARQLAPEWNFAADDYFEVNGKYRFDRSKLSEAHAECKANVWAAMVGEQTPIAVHNTFTTLKEMQPYLDMCEDHDYSPFVIYCESDFGNVHGVAKTQVDKMAKRWQSYREAVKEPVFEPVNVDRSLSKCIVVDIDGTLALNVSGRSPFDHTRYSEDQLNSYVAHVVASLTSRIPGDSTRHALVVMSGRENKDNAYNDTMSWLNRHNIYPDAFHMRANGDYRKDSLVKYEMLKERVIPHFNPVLVIDDRATVCKMWRQALGERICWQVHEGEF